MATDKERIDWLAKVACFEVEHEYLGPVSILSDGKLGSGRDLRAAIDAAMKNEKRRAITGVAEHAMSPDGGGNGSAER